VDYLGISPVFGTDTKTDISEPFGTDGLRKIRSMTKLPLVAIGGVKPNNAAQILEAGADGLAVVSAIMGAENPSAAAMEFAEIIKTVRI
jgi:thiamine-phosphate pyrophosphorylase